MQPRRNILLFHMGALGDFIVTWPIALALARLHPQSRVFYVTAGQKGALAERVLRLESIDVEMGGWHRLFMSEADLPALTARQLAGAHTIISFFARPDDVWLRNVQMANPNASLHALSTVAPSDYAGHQAEFLADQLHEAPAVATGTRQILRSIAERGLGSRSAGSSAIVIHPGGGAARKCWSPERYLQLVKALTQRGQSVRVILGEVELEQWPKDAIERFRGAAEVVAPATLSDLLAQLASARAFVGNDSGPGHLAGILGVPTLALFGSTSDPLRWRPLGPTVKVIHQPLEEIDVAAVLKELDGLA